MDALALLCNLHGDGPETLRRLRAAGCLDLVQVGELPRAQLDRLLGRGSLAAERFRREGRLLEKRLGGDVALTDGVAATDALGRSNESQDLREWSEADRGERGPAAGATGAESAGSGGLVHPFPPRKRPATAPAEAANSEGPSSGSILGAFLDRWRDSPQEPPSPGRHPESAPKPTPELTHELAPDSPPEPVAANAPGEGPSAIRQLAEWAQQSRASQGAAEVLPAPTDQAPDRVQAERPDPSRETRAKEAPAAERAPRPRTSGRASELLDHWAAESALPPAARSVAAVPPPAPQPVPQPAPPVAAPSPANSPGGRAPAAGTPLGLLPGGERCGPSLEALAFAGLTCLEDLAQAPARQLAERSGLAYTEVLRLQFLAERYLSRS